MLLNIQALRALAAFLVVFVHLQVLATGAGLGPNATEFGNSGVDLFFVISGMIMVFTTARGGATAARFLRHRIVRIVPFYWTITLAVFLVALAAPQLVQATRADPMQLIKSLLFIPFVKANGLTQPVVFVGWSLNYEMAFYVLFAAGLLVPRRGLGLCLCCAGLALAVLAGQLLHPTGPLGAFYTSPIMLEFGFGVGLGAALPHLKVQPWMRAPAAAAAALAFALMIAGPWLWPQADRLLMFGVPAAVIVAAALVMERAGWRAGWPILKTLGDASYATYLTHFFITQAVIRAAVAVNLTGPAPALLETSATLVLVALAGVVAHRLIEIPVTDAARELITRRRAPAALAS